MFPHCSHITSKRGVYYYRRRLPRPHPGEVALSLRTRNYRAAEHLAVVLDSAFGDALEQATGEHQSRPGATLQCHLKRIVTDELRPRVPTPVPEGIAEAPSAVQKHVDLLMTRYGLPEPLRTVLARGLSEGPGFDSAPRGDHAAIDSRGLQTEDDQGPRDIASPQAANAAGRVEVPVGPKLSDVLPGFMKEMDERQVWSAQTRHQNQATYRLFRQVAGDHPVERYSRREHVTPFYEVLHNLPKTWGKSSRNRHRDPSEVAMASADLPPSERLSGRTLKRHFTALRVLFDYLNNRGLYDAPNPVGKLRTGDKGRQGSTRQPWQGERLTALFKTPVWTGRRSLERRKEPGPNIIWDAWYWLPLLCLFHGNRLEELAQLRRRDVRQEEGIWFFDIHDRDDNKLKNRHSIRRVPIHPRALDLGFLDYLTEVTTKPEDRAFPELKPGGPDSRLGQYISRRWKDYCRATGVYDPDLVIHSFRHGVVTKLYGVGVEAAIVRRLVGHEGQGIGEKVYLHEVPLPVLYDAIRKVEWPEVDHLQRGSRPKV